MASPAAPADVQDELLFTYSKSADKSKSEPRKRWRLCFKVRSHFRPEFINTTYEFTVFKALQRKDIKHIVILQAKRVEERLQAKKMKMKLLEPDIEFLAEKGHDPVYGARPVKRAVQQELETALAKALLRG